MRRYKRYLVLMVALAILVMPITAQAKVEDTHEVELIDMGNGIWVPSSFDVFDENGNYVTLSSVDPSYLELQEIEDEPYSVTLDNGYRAVKEWLPYSTNSKMGYVRTAIYDEEGEMVFILGTDNMGDLLFGMVDEEGNYVKNKYSRIVYTDFIDIEVERVSSKNEDGALQPLVRITYDSEEEVAKKYIKWGDCMQLDRKIEYDEKGSGICTVYGKINTNYKAYDQEDDYYESYSYKEEDMQTYTPTQVITIVGQGSAYVHNQVTVPSKVTQHGEELYLVWLDDYYTGIEWSDCEGDQMNEAARAGRPVESGYYFTQEQIDLMEAEGITTVDEIREKYPEFLDTFGGFTDTYCGCDQEEPEFVRRAREKEEAIIRAKEEEPKPTEEPVEEPTEEPAEEPVEEVVEVIDDKWRIAGDGSRVCWQELTGDVVPINGMVPAHLMSQELKTPVGIQYTAILYDANYNMIVHCMNFDLEHTNYKYAYITRMDMALGMAEVAGTDTPISGNLHYMGETTYETEGDPVTGDVYGEYETDPGMPLY